MRSSSLLYTSCSPPRLQDPFDFFLLLSTSFEPAEVLGHLSVNSVCIVEPVEDVAAAERDSNMPNTKTRNAVIESCILLETEVENMKKAVMVREQGRFL